MSASKAISDAVQALEYKKSSDRINFGDIAKALNHKGFGPMLMVPAILSILPMGAIPGVPAICGIFITLTAGQIVSGRNYPWLPGFIRKFSVKKKRIISALNRAGPYAKRIDRYIKPRLDFLSAGAMTNFVALVCCLLGVAMTLLGFIPFLPAALCLPILFFALGMISRDGVMILGGFSFALAACAVLFYFSSIWAAG